MAITFASATIPSVFAQDATGQEEIYKRFLDNRKGPSDEKLKVAIAAGEEYLQKFGADPLNKEIVDYINKQLPVLKKVVADNTVVARFNQSVPAKNWDEAFSAGKEILAKNPDNVDVMLILASIGFDNAVATPPVDKYNADAVAIAKNAIQKINEGKTSVGGNYGAFGKYEYKTDKFADGKSNALGWMNYTVGYIMYNRQNMKKEALPFLYKATQANSGTKSIAEIYRSIGAWYLDEFNRIGLERKAKIEANNNEDNDETKTLLALQMGYTERAIDAYSRASKIANANPDAAKEYKDGLLSRIKELYAIRFEGKTDGLDAYTATLTAKPFPDPTTPVTPVVEKTTTAATSPTAVTIATPAAKPSTSVTAPSVKPAVSTTPVTAPAKTTKTPAKKPVTKKKGTR